MLFLSVVCNAGGVFIVKKKLNEMGAIDMGSLKAFLGYLSAMGQSPLVIAGVGLFFIAPFLFAIALSRLDMTVAYPAQVGLNFLLLLLLAILFLGEAVTAHRLIGVALVLASICFLSR
jgi:multidrug transporter EmrE-like cation transporter